MATLGFPTRGLAAVTALAVLAACTDRPEPTAPAGPALATSTGAATAADTVPTETLVYEAEREYEEIGREVPGYGGHYFDDQGNRVVMLVDLSQGPLAEKVIGARPQPELTEGEKRTGLTRFVQVRYSFATLQAWRNRASDPVLNVPGAQGIDADEGQNRITVWIADESARAGVESALRVAGVPVGGYFIELGKIEAHQTLSNFFRPLQGGYQTQTNFG
ncbi:MAG TPA: hypothetical protein VFR81_04190, partial [Longimicrobium sp.]|nr:hypothetical protein [Longimicrobium sp.]